MSATIPQQGAYARMFALVASSDHIARLSGAQSSLTLLMSKGGGTFTSFTQSLITDMGNGFYKASLRTSDTITLGDLAFDASAIGADPQQWTDQVVPTTVTAGTVIDKNGYTISGTVTTGTLLDKTGYFLASNQTVTTGTLLDKAGFSLAQAFPSNFSALGINAAGALSQSVTSGTVLDKTNYTGHMTADSLLGNPLVTTAAYAASQDPGTYVLATPANKLSTDATGAAAITSNIKKGVAYSNFPILMTDSTNHNPLAALSVALSIAAESSTSFTALVNSSATEIALGTYRANLTAGETNVNRFTLRATASGADARFISVNTQP